MSEPLLTLEPLLDAIREGLEGAGWALSGLQKTTSHQFEGRWKGESTRSAYLFFHRPDLPDGISIDIFLDETSKGLKGNIALVLDGPLLGQAGDADATLKVLSGIASSHLPSGYRSPITLRLWLEGSDRAPDEAESEYRFKVHYPKSVVQEGGSAVHALTGTIVRAFESVLGDGRLARFRPPD
jgi:hypothetical protein